MDLKTLSFAGRTALVTGGAQGIGQAIARQLAELDAKVIILDVNAEKAEETCREIGCGCSFRRVDLSDGDALSAAMERLIREVERVDVLINNAGVVNTSDFETLSRADWDRVLAIDLTAVFLTSQAVFRNMAANGGGRIVNVASIAGKVGGGYLGTAAYAAAKAGVISLTKSIAKAGAGRGICCNSVCPAYTKTPLVSILTGEKEAKVLSAMALHRAADPAEVANAVLFLASDAASFITGENLNCDGGMLMNG